MAGSSTAIGLDAKIATITSAASASSTRAPRRAGSPSPARSSASVSPQASADSTPAFGLNPNASPQNTPASTSRPVQPRARNRSIAHCAARNATAEYQAGYGTLNDANSPMKQGSSAA